MTKEEFKEARMLLGYTQKQMGVELDMSETMIGFMERGRSANGNPVGIEKRTELAVRYLLLTNGDK